MAARSRFGNEAPRSTSYSFILGYTSIFVALTGFLMLLPLVMLAFYPSEWECYLAFLIPGASCILLGVPSAFLLLHNKANVSLGKHQDSVLLVFIWLAATLCATLPFVLSGPLYPHQDAVRMSFTESFFEMASGFSTTGYTVFKDTLDGVAAYGISSLFCPHIYLFYRAIVQFFGGVGLILVVASVISNKHGAALFYAEGHNDRLLPNLGQTAKAIFGIYFGFITVGTICLWLFGFDWFEALCTSISGMATGGFGTRSNSLYSMAQQVTGNGVFAYNPIGAEITTMFIMLFGGTSFLLLFRLVTFNFKRFFRDCEIRFMLFFLAVFIPLMTVSIFYEYNNYGGIDFPTALRYASFQTISCIATTGYVNAPSITILGQVAIYISILAMLIGGGSGSTSGGIKQYRLVMVMKELGRGLKYRLAPSAMIWPHTIVRDGEVQDVDDATYRENASYILLYLTVIIISAMALTFLPGLSFGEAFYQIVSGITSGGNAIVDPISYSAAQPQWAYYSYLWIVSVVMLLGRLEILPFYFSAVRVTRDVLNKETV